MLGNREKSTWIQKSTELFFSYIVCIGQDIFDTKIGKILKNHMLFEIAVKLSIRQPISTIFRYVRNNLTVIMSVCYLMKIAWYHSLFDPKTTIYRKVSQCYEWNDDGT